MPAPPPLCWDYLGSDFDQVLLFPENALVVLFTPLFPFPPSQQPSFGETDGVISALETIPRNFLERRGQTDGCDYVMILGAKQSFLFIIWARRPFAHMHAAFGPLLPGLTERLNFPFAYCSKGNVYIF